METPALAAAWFLVFAAPISLWVAWSDLSAMRIPNRAVLALIAGFVVTAPFLLPLVDVGWRLVQLLVVLVIGFGMNAARLVGGGDAKFAAAMAPFIAAGDVLKLFYLFAAILIAAFVVHRSARAIPFVRNVVPGWVSWTHRGFPMGFPMGSALIFYLLIAAFPGSYGAFFASRM